MSKVFFRDSMHDHESLLWIVSIFPFLVGTLNVGVNCCAGTLLFIVQSLSVVKRKFTIVLWHGTVDASGKRHSTEPVQDH